MASIVLFLSAYDSLQNILQLVGIIIIFLIILAAAYAASVFVGKTQNNTYHAQERNIKIVETFRISGNQFLQIVKIGNRYFALAVSKERMELIAELKEDEFRIPETADATLPFQDVFEKVKSKFTKTQKDDRKK